ncbi:MAG: hypothetical protein IJJ45_00095 [Clostridia bacterium]|nr:hypothetical protein [Clostridia bacterium]
MRYCHADPACALLRHAFDNRWINLKVQSTCTWSAWDHLLIHTRRVDTAVRMNVLDAMRRMNQRVMEEVGRQFGADGVEIDAHMLCAEDHLPYQGLQFTNEEFEDIQGSLPRPFGEWNCRHTWAPIIMGLSPRAYTDDDLARFERYSTEPVTIDGTTKTRYEWSQAMRRMETAIREKKDTATLAAAAGDDQLRRQCQGSISAMVKEYERLSDRTGLGPDFRRTYVAGFGDAKSGKELTGAKEDSILKRDDILVLRSLSAKATAPDDEEITVPSSRFPAYFVSGEYIRNVEVFAGSGTKTPIRERFDLADFYKGTDPNDWEKVKGIAHVIHLGEEHIAEVHWYYEVSYGGVEYKVKPQEGGRLWLDER